MPVASDAENNGESQDSLGRVEDRLHGILSELDADEMGVDDRVAVEHACQEIHAAFGGQDPDAIYRDLQDPDAIYRELQTENND